ncbi:hypothetical protein BGX26_004912 [Mortierella sp. AD094]|nr:hypothetical protein BGX26_004912 [Mortierella sp. AD094]
MAFDHQGWVCLDLQIFSIFICGLDDKPPEWQQGVLQQLAKLENLHRLSIGQDNADDEVEGGGLDLRLDAGLDILKSTKKTFEQLDLPYWLSIYFQSLLVKFAELGPSLNNLRASVE